MSDNDTTFEPNYYLEEADKRSCVEVCKGVWLTSSDNMVEEQKSWPADDPNKKTDLETAPYWLSFDGGQDLCPIYDGEDLLDALS